MCNDANQFDNDASCVLNKLNNTYQKVDFRGIGKPAGIPREILRAI